MKLEIIICLIKYIWPISICLKKWLSQLFLQHGLQLIPRCFQDNFYVPFTVISSILDIGLYQTKWSVFSHENVQTDLLVLSAGPPSMPWANRSSPHELEGGISVKPTQNVIMHYVPNFYFFPLSYLIKLELLHLIQIAPCHSTFLSFTNNCQREIYSHANVQF